MTSVETNVRYDSLLFTRWCLLAAALLLSGCGTLTGLPGHGGGKRFAVEQEMVAAAARGAIKQIDLTTLKGKKVNIFVNAIGDTGAGNLLGGRFSIASQLRGDYLHAPTTTEQAVFPRYTTKSTSDFSSSTTESTLNAPTTSTSQQKGSGGLAQMGMKSEGLGVYQNSTELPSNDLQYLSALLQTYLYLQDVRVVPPSEAEIDVYITVDVFGTIRSREDWLFTNSEILRAKTSLEVLAVENSSGRLVMPPQVASAETEYKEKFVFWIGPTVIKKSLNKSQPLLSDFTDFDTVNKQGESVVREDIQLPSAAKNKQKEQ